MKTIMVQMRDRAWTLEALHEACGLARKGDTQVVLMRFIPVMYMRWTGKGMNMSLSKVESADLQAYCETAEDYGVELNFYQREVHSLDSAIPETAEMIGASEVFATLPQRTLRPLRTLQMRHMETRLNEQHCQLHTLETAPTHADWSPAAAFPLSR